MSRVALVVGMAACANEAAPRGPYVQPRLVAIGNDHFAYDADGRPTLMRRDDRTIQLAWTGDDLTVVRDDASLTPVATLEYAGDQLVGLAAPCGPGCNVVRRDAFTYSADGLLESWTTSFDGTSRDRGFQHDDAGRLEAIYAPNGVVFELVRPEGSPCVEAVQRTQGASSERADAITYRDGRLSSFESLRVSYNSEDHIAAFGGAAFTYEPGTSAGVALGLDLPGLGDAWTYPFGMIRLDGGCEPALNRGSILRLVLRSLRGDVSL